MSAEITKVTSLLMYKGIFIRLLIYLGFDPFLSMVYKYFTIYISMFSTLLGMFSGSGAFRSKAMTLEHFGA